jgi:hypothetical protein
MLSAFMLSGIAILHARADESASRPVSSRHQLMKECMAKQKASNAGLSSDQMKKTCRDLAETEVENAKAERMRGQAGGTPQK